MTHADILDQRDSLRNPLLGSVLFHAAVFGLFVLYTWYLNTHTARLGSAEQTGGSVGVNVVKTLNLPHRAGPENRLASDTESRVPTPEKLQPKKRQVEPDEKAIPLKSREQPKKLSKPQQNLQRYHAQPVKPNQVTSSLGQALVSKMVAKQGSGGVGANTNSALGNQFGWYLDLVKQRIASKWDTTQVDARVQTASPVIVDFDILRDGSIANLRVIQRSGIPTLDYSTQRAVTEAGPFPQLPGGYNNAPMEILFQLQR